MNEEIQELVDKTTIVQVINNVTDKVEFGNENITSRYYNHQEQQIDINTLKEHWIKKWGSFGDEWNEERQLYRHFQDTFKLFYYSFYQLVKNKKASIPLNPGDEMLNLYVELSNVNLFGIYSYGKKCIDLIKKLNLHSSLGENDTDFIRRFKETRNKIFEHNYNPSGLNMTTDPSSWSIASTNSICDISIHGAKEREFDAKIDYYDDYYKLENVLTSIIMTF